MFDDPGQPARHAAEGYGELAAGLLERDPAADTNELLEACVLALLAIDRRLAVLSHDLAELPGRWMS
jgi:hypothetical protein